MSERYLRHYGHKKNSRNIVESVMPTTGALRAAASGKVGKFTTYLREKDANGKDSYAVDYSACISRVTFSRYGENRYTSAALLALDVPVSEWSNYPDIRPKILSPSSQELEAGIEKYQIGRTAINIAVVPNTGLKEKMMDLRYWQRIMTTAAATLRHRRNETRPIHFHVFYNPNQHPEMPDF
jgi:hypothetical protein